MATKEPSDEFAAALIAAKAKMGNALKNKTNPHFKSKYADLGAIRDATIVVLKEHGLTLEQKTGFDEHGNFNLYTRIRHSTNAADDWSVWPILNAPDKPQAMGSALTYGTRYQWGLKCGIASEEDDDANAASEVKPKPRTLRDNPNYGLANQARKAGTYPVFEKEMRACPSLPLLRSLWANWQDEMKSWPAEWRVLAEEEKNRRKQELADELPITEQLKESIGEIIGDEIPSHD